MHRILPLVLVVAVSLLATACGGDDDSGSDKGSSKQERKVDRAGYFSDDQSDELNPAIVEWNTASRRYYSGYDACNDEATKKFEAGATPRESVACHLRDTKAMIVSLQGLEEVVDDLDGEWRETCDEQLATFAEDLEAQRVAFETLQADWVAYANGKPTPKINQHSAAADKLANAFNAATVDLSKACYTKADRDEQAKDAEDAGDAAKDE